MIYNVSMKIAHLLENEQAAAVFDRFLPGMRKMAESNPQAAALSVEQLVRYTRNPRAEEVIAALNAALNELNTPENAITPGERKLIDQFKSIDAADKAKEIAPSDHMQNAIYPGRPWLDTGGERIQAHGGAVFFENGVYWERGLRYTPETGVYDGYITAIAVGKLENPFLCG